MRFKIYVFTLFLCISLQFPTFSENNLKLQIESAKLITEYNSDTSVNDIDTITFGSYPQSDVTGKTKEPIEWIVLDRDEENKKALLLSKYILDCKPYNDEYKEVTWETCSLRKWLNQDFYNIAFNDSAKIYITLTSLINNDNVDCGSNGGNNTSDSVFLLSIDEIKHYFENNDQNSIYTGKGLFTSPTRYCKKLSTKGTDYAKNVKDIEDKILYVYSKEDYEKDIENVELFPQMYEQSNLKAYEISDKLCIGNSFFYLRSPGETNEYASFVTVSALINIKGRCVDNHKNNSNIGIRPAIWVNYYDEEEAIINTNNKTTMLQKGDNDIEIDKDLEKLYETWDDNMFNNTSYQYSHKIARISAMLSEAAYTESKIENLLLNEFKFSKVKFYNYNYSKSMKIGYDGTNCFSVAHKNVGDSATVIISVRGTKEFSEMLGDAFKYDFINGQYLHSMNNVAVYDHIYDFYEQIKIGVENYFAENSNLQKIKNLKILITGHSLGGAAANCYAAGLIANIDNNKLNSYLEKNNIYTYTFGAIKVFKKRLDQNVFDIISNILNGVPNYSEGYMNIFNIYNHYDSFGPNGNYAWTKASAPQQKFGHTFIYNDEKLHFEEINKSHVWTITMEDVNKGWYDLFFRGSIFKFLENVGKLVEKPENLFGTFNNHNMTNYMAALNIYDFSSSNKKNIKSRNKDLPYEIFADKDEVPKNEKKLSNNKQVASDTYYYYFDDKNRKILHFTSKNITGKTREVKTIKPGKNNKANYYYGNDKVPFKGNNPIAYKYSDEIDNVINVETIVIDDNLKLDSTAYLFSGFKKLKEVNTNFIDVSETLYMRGMFNKCESLTEIDLGMWQTDKVVDMSHMFNSCSSLTYLDLSKWNTHSVNSLEFIFCNCGLLNYIDVSNWNVLNVEHVEGMFFMCSSLEYLDVGKWNIKSVKNLTYLFSGCTSLKTIDVSKWDTSKVTNMSYTFNMCTSLLELNVSNWNTSSATLMNGMFANCSSLVEIDVSRWNTSKVEDMSNMFFGCKSLENLDVHSWNVENTAFVNYMFAECPNLKTVDVSNWNLNKAAGVESMFGK